MTGSVAPDLTRSPANNRSPFRSVNSSGEPARIRPTVRLLHNRQTPDRWELCAHGIPALESQTQPRGFIALVAAYRMPEARPGQGQRRETGPVAPDRPAAAARWKRLPSFRRGERRPPAFAGIQNLYRRSPLLDPPLQGIARNLQRAALHHHSWQRNWRDEREDLLSHLVRSTAAKRQVRSSVCPFRDLDHFARFYVGFARTECGAGKHQIGIRRGFRRRRLPARQYTGSLARRLPR